VIQIEHKLALLSNSLLQGVLGLLTRLFESNPKLSQQFFENKGFHHLLLLPGGETAKLDGLLDLMARLFDVVIQDETFATASEECYVKRVLFEMVSGAISLKEREKPDPDRPAKGPLASSVASSAGAWGLSTHAISGDFSVSVLKFLSVYQVDKCAENTYSVLTQICDLHKSLEQPAQPKRRSGSMAGKHLISYEEWASRQGPANSSKANLGGKGKAGKGKSKSNTMSMLTEKNVSITLKRWDQLAKLELVPKAQHKSFFLSQHEQEELSEVVLHGKKAKTIHSPARQVS